MVGEKYFCEVDTESACFSLNGLCLSLALVVENCRFPWFIFIALADWQRNVGNLGKGLLKRIIFIPIDKH